VLIQRARLHVLVAISVAAITIAGCYTSEYVRSLNRGNLIQLALGMTKAEVLSTMGTATYVTDTGLTITNPYRSEILRGKNNAVFEILFYYTDVKRADDAITDDELTPVILEEGKVVGWGWLFLQDTANTYELRLR
jgi:Protein of unknown function (DUF3192)